MEAAVRLRLPEQSSVREISYFMHTCCAKALHIYPPAREPQILFYYASWPLTGVIYIARFPLTTGQSSPMFSFLPFI